MTTIRQADRCPVRICGARMELLLDPLGRVVPRCHACERRRAGICRDCAAPVHGQAGKATRCAVHRRAARARQQRESVTRHNAERLARGRRYAERPEVKARKTVARRAWAAAHPERVKAHVRAYHLKQTPGYIAGYQRNNARPERAAQKREQALQKYYEQHPTRPTPVCRRCGRAITYPGTGRPAVTCGRRGRCDA